MIRLNKKNVRPLLSIIVLISILGITIFFLKKDDKPDAIMADLATEKFVPVEKIFFEKFEESNFTCTGITYDKNNNSFWIADYGALDSSEETKPRLVEVDKELKKELSTIELDLDYDKQINLQGITYDEKTDSLWLAVGQDIVNIDKTGKTIDELSLGKYSKYSANGIAYDDESDTLWVLCYRKWLLQMDKDGKILDSIKVNYKGQDHICFSPSGSLLMTVGDDYAGEDNFLVEIDIRNKNSTIKCRIQESYAIEGCIVIDKKLYVVNDGLYHNAKIKKSYISVYDFKE